MAYGTSATTAIATARTSTTTTVTATTTAMAPSRKNEDVGDDWKVNTTISAEAFPELGKAGLSN